jgi:hypothetical protein
MAFKYAPKGILYHTLLTKQDFLCLARYSTHTHTHIYIENERISNVGFSFSWKFRNMHLKNAFQSERCRICGEKVTIIAAIRSIYA